MRRPLSAHRGPRAFKPVRMQQPRRPAPIRLLLSTKRAHRHFQNEVDEWGGVPPAGTRGIAGICTGSPERMTATSAEVPEASRSPPFAGMIASRVRGGWFRQRSPGRRQAAGVSGTPAPKRAMADGWRYPGASNRNRKGTALVNTQLQPQASRGRERATLAALPAGRSCTTGLSTQRAGRRGDESHLT